MEIVIVGAGNIGFSIGKSLCDDGHNVVIVEKDQARASAIDDELDAKVVVGNGSSPDILAEAGIWENCAVDYIIACTPHDEVNIMACWLAKRCGVKKAIARAKSVEYINNAHWQEALGIDEIISPERSVARSIEEMFRLNGVVHTTELLAGKAGTYAFRVEEGSFADGASLKSVGLKHPDLRFVIVYIEREEKGNIPHGDWVMQKGDLCYLITFKDYSKGVQSLFSAKDHKKELRRVLVIGGSKLGLEFIFRMSRNHHEIDISFIDKDLEKCNLIAELFPKTAVFHGEGTDEKLLKSVGIEKVDGFLASTSSDEQNIVLGIIAMSMGAGKAIAIVKNNTYLNHRDKFSVSSLVNPHEALISNILKRLNYPETAGSLSHIGRIGAEILEVILPDNSPVVGKAVMDINLPKGILFAMVNRNGKTLVPRGDFILNGQDTLLLFAMHERMQSALKHLGIVG